MALLVPAIFSAPAPLVVEGAPLRSASVRKGAIWDQSGDLMPVALLTGPVSGGPPDAAVRLLGQGGKGSRSTVRALGPSSAAQSVWREPVRALNRLLRRRLCFLVFSGSLERAARGRQSSTGADYTTRASARFCFGPCLPRPAPPRAPSTMERGGLGLPAGAVGSVAGSGCHAGRLPSRVRLQPPPVVTGERPKPCQDSPPASAYTRSHAWPRPFAPAAKCPPGTPGRSLRTRGRTR